MGHMWSQAPLNCAIRTGMLWKPKPGPCSAAAVHRQRSRSATAPIRRSASRLPHKQCLTQQRRVNRYSPDSWRFRGPDRAFEWLGQWQIALPQAKGDPSGRLMAAKRLNMPLRPHQAMPLPSPPRCTCPKRRSCHRRRDPQPGNQRQDVREYLPRHRDRGHLERDVAPMADHLGDYGSRRRNAGAQWFVK